MQKRRFVIVVLIVLDAVTDMDPAPSASAHAMPTSAVLPDIGPRGLGHHSDAVGPSRRHPISLVQAQGSQRSELMAYTRRHLSVTGANGARWTVTVGGRVEQVDAARDFVVGVSLTPPNGRPVSDFTLRYDAIIERLETHRALVRNRSDFDHGDVSADGGRLIGVLDWNHASVAVPASGGSTSRGLIAMVRLGVEHVSTGSEHLLFLLTLLLPAPLLVVDVGGSAEDRPEEARTVSCTR